jgi:threonylcarbamoyladenosine tRNA methylthiotransferase MtaB
MGVNRLIKVSIQTLGCKLNLAESERLAREMARAGYVIVSPPEKADIYVLNSCTVTGIADRKARQALRNMREANSDAVIIATGCYAERAPDEIRHIEGVNFTLGNRDKGKLVEFLGSIAPAFIPDDVEHGLEANLRTRAFISVQDGCSNFCAYCIVPYVRGKEKSRPVDEIVTEVKDLVKDGYREIVLTGTEIGAYDFAGINLKQLVKRLLSETGIARLRLSSLQPQELTPEFLDLWRDPRLCRHFHISLQSGSESVLKRMRRRYSAREYHDVVSLIRSRLPDAAITTDVIVGFPGETDAEFAESYNFAKEMDFARIHVFPYSPRPGTAAASMSGQIDGNIKKERSRRMLALSKESVRRFLMGFLGKIMRVLWESAIGGKAEGVWSGLTDNYIRVYIKSDGDLTNRFTDVKLVRLYRDGLWGEADGETGI